MSKDNCRLSELSNSFQLSHNHDAAEFTAARLYDLAYYSEATSDKSLARFLKRCIETYAAGRNVLDCACGTGEPGLSLADSFAVSLSDRSREMLEIAREKANKRGLRSVSYSCAAWHELDKAWPKPFDAVLCSGNSLAQCLTHQDRLDALAGMSSVTGETGIMYVDFKHQSNIPLLSSFTLQEVIGPIRIDMQQVLVLIHERKEGAIVRRVKDCYLVKGRRLRRVASARTSYLPFRKRELLADLKSVGFAKNTTTRRPGRWPLTVVIAWR
jgi:ubiquinone/menaquinone biosynthesis C-methylase UbiE